MYAIPTKSMRMRATWKPLYSTLSQWTGFYTGQTGLHTGRTGLHTGQTGLHTGLTGLHTGQTGLCTGQTGLCTGQTGLHTGLTGLCTYAGRPLHLQIMVHGQGITGSSQSLLLAICANILGQTGQVV